MCLWVSKRNRETLPFHVPKVEDGEARTMETELHKERLFIFLSWRKERRRLNIMETRYYSCKSYDQVRNLYRPSRPGEPRATHTALPFSILLTIIIRTLAQSKQTPLQLPIIGRWTLGGLILPELLHSNIPRDLWPSGWITSSVYELVYVKERSKGLLGVRGISKWSDCNTSVIVAL